MHNCGFILKNASFAGLVPINTRPVLSRVKGAGIHAIYNIRDRHYELTNRAATVMER